MGSAHRLRGRHLRRQMIHREFALIWETQAKHHPELTGDLRYGSHGAQRDPTAVVRPVAREKGKSLLEQFGLENLHLLPSAASTGPSPPSAAANSRRKNSAPPSPTAASREFRMLSELNNLRMTDDSAQGKPTERPLTETEREAALKYLSTTKKPTLAGLKRKLAALPESPQADQITFNLEGGKRDSISGLATEYTLSNAIGKKSWAALDEDTKNHIVDILTHSEERRPAKKAKVIQRTDDETRALLESVTALDSGSNRSPPRHLAPLRLLPPLRKGARKTPRPDAQRAHLPGQEG